jgi:hypothetical protein
MTQVYVAFQVTNEKNPKQALNVIRTDNKIKYIVDYENQADLKIFFVSYQNQAGWRNSSKRHLLY